MGSPGGRGLSPPQATLTFIGRLHPTLSVHCLQFPFFLVVTFWAFFPFQGRAKHLTSSISFKFLKNPAKVTIQHHSEDQEAPSPAASLSLLMSFAEWPRGWEGL